jgi:starch-binding outer membrane protein, SusD/RagB family
MKNLLKIFLGILVFSPLTISCERLLDVDSNRLVLPDEHQMDSPNDTLYSMVGIFSQLEKLSDRYVLLGELRGDLMDITKYANPDIREIYNFEILPDNPYNQLTDYYSVINNCNYLIQNIDTSAVAKAEKVMYKEFAAAKAIRAWTYLQIALNYGNVKYYEQPVLSIQNTKEYTELSLQELIPVLIQDLLPWKNIEKPGEISLGESITSERSFFPIRFLLGDLYLWNGEYENAAIEYYELIETNRYILDDRYSSEWTVNNGVFVSKDWENLNWSNMFYLSSPELITLIAGSLEFGQGANLDSLSIFNFEIEPSTVAIDNWDKQIYYYNESVFTEGDLRGSKGSYINLESNLIIGGNKIDNTDNQITKYYFLSSTTTKGINIYRTGLLYLRYAEAVNRAGKPNLAFAVLKNGLNSNTLAVDSIVPVHEKYIGYSGTPGTFLSYVNFEDEDFDDNVGIHSRGCGNVKLATDFKIPAKTSLQDSILFVENKILEELALETAFEGNRFHDLMRIALRRNSPAFLADKVAAKYTENKEAIRNKLMDINNWYLP